VHNLILPLVLIHDITSHISNNLFLLFSWTTSGLKSQGRLSVGSNRDREISMSVGLGRSQLDSKGGVVGGTIDVNALEMVGMLEFNNYTAYFQTLCLKKRALES
jgi:hypothetical protein